ncbi:tRNA (adenosine(37)-N6)-dimethylallyltransferase MiaA [Massilia sp. W12]|uniref:tRNA (adenosine(37)-N6)-dimethylallyltransferase MiaA n=1 Tax=Massilia sp. W12 TaxID=3126507 RepID=UPI0030D09D80
MQQAKPLVLALLGPTASGKTACALELARHFPLEIISMDSALVYRGMDIGTAKPSAEERAAAPHHLIDIIAPAEAYSVAQFAADCSSLIAQIQARGRFPVIVGGTMLYYKGLSQGLDDLPQADPAIRARLEDEIARDGIAALHARLAQVDPHTAQRLPPGDTQRIQRALEIFMLTGQPMSALLARRSTPELPFRLWPVSLEPSERSALHARIAQRFLAMLQGSPNLLDEVEILRRDPDLHPNLPSMRCVGYRQAWDYLDGRIDMAALKEQGIAATRQLAKRQLTWLRAMPERVVLDCLRSDCAQQLRDLFSAEIQKNP